MKTQIKRALCLMLALAMLVLAMAACGGDKKTDNSAVQNSQDASTPKEHVEAPSIYTESVDAKYKDPNWNPYATMSDKIKGTTVRYATWTDHTRAEGALAYANIYNDIGIKVEPYIISQTGYVNTIMTKSAAGDIPDVFITNEGEGAFPLTLQIAAPINKVTTVDLKDPIFDQTYLDYATINGNVYFVQTLGSPHTNGNLVFFNKTLFADNGFTSPAEYYEQGNWTWDTLLKCAKDIKSLGEDYKGIHCELDILADSAGACFVQYDAASDMFSNGVNDAKLKAVCEWYVDAKSQGLMDGNQGAFTQGKCGIFIRGVFGLKTNGYFRNMDPNDVGFTYLPSEDGSENAYVSAIFGGHGIVENAPNADAAGYFLRYFLDYKNYDLDNTFLTVDAGNFYYELVDVPASGKFFSHDEAASFAGNGASHNTFWSPVMNAGSTAQVNTKLQEVSPLVDLAVDAANKLIQDKIAADKKNYK